MINAPPAPSRSTETSNVVISAAPRSPRRLFKAFCAFLWLRFVFDSRFIRVNQAPSVDNRVAQSHVGRQLYLRWGLITFVALSADCRKSYSNGDDNEFGVTWRDFGFVITRGVLYIGDVNIAATVDRCVVSNFFVEVAKDQ